MKIRTLEWLLLGLAGVGTLVIWLALLKLIELSQPVFYFILGATLGILFFFGLRYFSLLRSR